MRIALVDTTKRPTYYPVALLKIGAWRKSLGDECILYSNRLPDEADEIWLTTCFTFDIPHARRLVKAATKRAPVVRVGGISATLLPEKFADLGVEVHRGLLPDAEQFSPDYGLLPEPTQYSVTHTSRGCIRKCKFCMVHRLEPEFTEREWTNDLAPGAPQIRFYDNNWLAKDQEALQRDVERLWRLLEAGTIKEVDFNQGLDCRLLIEGKADLLTGLPIHPVRFAFDGMQEDGHYQRAVTMMVERGHRDFMTYVLYNFTDTPQDFYYRLRESARLTEELSAAVSSFPMRYQPILEADAGRAYVGKNWTEKQKKGFMDILNRQSVGGGISTENIGEFEFWFGKDSTQFVRLLSYPRIKELAAAKKGQLRLMRSMS